MRELDLGENSTKKPVPKLYKRKDYVVHYRNLKLYLSLGMTVTNVHQIPAFQQKPWLREYKYSKTCVPQRESYEVYYDPNNAGSFALPDNVFRFVRKTDRYLISKSNIRKWLQNQETYSLQRPLRKHFQRNKIMVSGNDDQWSADLMDMVKFAEFNEEYKYVLVEIDFFQSTCGCIF